MYKVIYFTDLNIVTSRDFDDVTDARAFAATCDWAKIVNLAEPRTITDVSLT